MWSSDHLIRRAAGEVVNTYAPTISLEIFLLLIMLIGLLNLHLESWDVSGAFLLAPHSGPQSSTQCS
jgi:hypothetical protein